MSEPQPGAENVKSSKSPITIIVAWTILFIGMVLTGVYTYHTIQLVKEEARKDFAFECTEIRFSVYDRLNAFAQLLRSEAAFFEASDSVSRNEWKAFITHQKIQQNLPGVQGVGYAMIVDAGQLKKHEQHIQNSGFPDYHINPPGKRNIYTSIIYLEPFSGRNLKAFGYDMFSEPIRREAMEKARDMHIAALSGKVILVQETEDDVQAGTLMYVPVYRSGIPRNTLDERRKAIKGWVYSPYRMNDLMMGILGHRQSRLSRGLRMQIYDADRISPEALLYDSQPFADNIEAELKSLKLSLPLIFNGKLWSLNFTQIQQPSSFYSKNVIIVMLVGTAISFLVFMLALLLLKNRYRLKLTTRLAGTLKANLDKQVALYNAIPDAVFVTDTKTGRIEEINHKASEQYGYTHPEFEALNRADLVAMQEQKESGGSTNPMFGYHLLHKKKDGSVLPVEITSSIFEIDNSEKTILVARDVTERFKAGEALHTSEALYKSIFNASPDNITVTDLQGRIIMVSPAAWNLFGLTNKDQLLGRDFRDLLAPKERKRATAIMELMLTSDDRRPLEFKWLHSDGGLIETEINGEIITNTYGHPTGYVLIIRDITERKLTEKTLRESEEKWRLLVSNSPDSIALHDKDGRYLFLNHFAEDFHENDILGHSIYEFLDPASTELFTSKYDECISTWKPVKFEHVAIGNSGNIRIFEESLVPVLTKNEEVNILAVAKDITEKKLSELKIQESEEHFRLIFENGSIAMALVNADFTFTQVNKAFVTLLGYSEAELATMTFSHISDPEYIEEEIQHMNRLINREIALYRTEKKYITRYKKTIWGLVQVSVMYNKAGEFVSLLVMINNLTERKRAEESLLKSEEIFTQFMLNSPIYVFFKDENIRSIRLSRNFEQMLGRPLKELLGKTMDEIFPSELAKEMVADDLRILHEGKQIEVEEELNGRYYSTTKFPIFIDGKPIYLAGYTIDITSRKLAGDTIKAALKDKEILLREIHHRVKNNLQVVSSLLNIQANKITDKAIKEPLEQSRNRIRSIALVHEKLYQSGNYAEINLKEYARSLINELFRVYLSDPEKIHIRTVIEEVNIPLIYAIPCGLILNEIISNSLKYAFPENNIHSHKPEIFISLKTLPGNYLQLSAGDNGIGLPSGYEQPSSSSLGLYLINILATEQLDGQIEIDTKKGTIFTITFNPYTK